VTDAQRLPVLLRVARAWQGWDHQQAADDFGLSRQTWVGWEQGKIPADRLAELAGWARKHTPQAEGDRAHAFGMLEAAGRMARLVGDISDDARRRLGDPTIDAVSPLRQVDAAVLRRVAEEAPSYGAEVSRAEAGHEATKPTPPAESLPPRKPRRKQASGE